MNKQKQFEIEKLTNIIKNCCCDIKAEYNCAAMCETCIAEDLYNAGYRKIPENAVVLTDEEYERWQGQTLNIKKVRKETAEKFAEMVKGFINKHKSPVGGNDFVLNVEQLIFGIDEICKELGGE